MQIKKNPIKYMSRQLLIAIINFIVFTKDIKKEYWLYLKSSTPEARHAAGVFQNHFLCPTIRGVNLSKNITTPLVSIDMKENRNDTTVLWNWALKVTSATKLFFVVQ